MSQDTNPVTPGRRRRVLLVAANPSVSPITGTAAARLVIEALGR